MKKFSREEVSKHHTKEDCWTIVHHEVFDVTEYMSMHPGGEDLLFKNAGKDSTSDFEGLFHSQKARKLLQNYKVGDLDDQNSITSNSQNYLTRFANSNQIKVPSAFPSTYSNKFSGNKRPNAFKIPNSPASSSLSSKPPLLKSITKDKQVPAILITSNEKIEQKLEPKCIISNNEFKSFKLKEKTTIANGVCPVRRYRFEIENPPHCSLGLPVGQHIELKAIINGSEVRRKYTPTSTNDDKGFFDLVIKVYPKGLMTQHMDSLAIGDSIEICGPRGLFKYQKNRYKKIGMIAGGTGITPMLQIITEVLKHPDDDTSLSLLFANSTIQDIILHEHIDKLTQKHLNFNAYHVLNEPPEGWNQGVGFITEEIIKKRLPAPEEGNIILLCGPPAMIDAMKKHLKSLGYERKHMFTF